ncbi:hypothetical protein IQ06DRAFT_362560 [Phaeosphaeriaceae sp. SRC1lsM3a]|nr:hypothetical protein IQ06DRAFT_362560 [Stagonospora sp. SRC1lsM3a]
MRSSLKTPGVSALALLLVCSTTTAQVHSPPADAAPTIDVGALFSHTASRNQRVITQAVDFVVSMQTAPTCTRMAASHLMNECKLLEHAPDFAKSRPDAYLDNVKTEYAAKLAVCELLSAQPANPMAPPNCDILVPTSRACSKGGSWWYSRPEITLNDKQCYPHFKEHQYVQCLKTLQSSPQYWTSFSNARQNAVIMCQASRDAIERENHLETFKNLTQVMGAVSDAMKKSTEEYESLLQDQKRSAGEARKIQLQYRHDVHAVQNKALATMETFDTKIHTFLEASMSELIAALADNQSQAISRIAQEMQAFQRDIMAESSEVARAFTAQLQAYHEQTLMILQTNHEAQVESFDMLSGRMRGLHDSVDKAESAANSSLEIIVNIGQRLVDLSDQADHIAQGFAFFSALPALLASIFHGAVAIVAIVFLFSLLCKVNKKLATYSVGACSSAYLFYICGVYQWLGSLPARAATIHRNPGVDIAELSSTQKVAGLIFIIWLGAYPVGCLNVYLGSTIGAAIGKLLGSYWFREYGNDGGIGLLPSVEIPASQQKEEQSHGEFDDRPLSKMTSHFGNPCLD